MSSPPQRPLLKGPLKPPPSTPKKHSYTQLPASKNKNEVTITTQKAKPFPVTQFNSFAVPQPFLDPAMIQKRIQAEKQWKDEQERKKKAAESSQGQGR